MTQESIRLRFVRPKTFDACQRAGLKCVCLRRAPGGGDLAVSQADGGWHSFAGI